MSSLSTMSDPQSLDSEIAYHLGHYINGEISSDDVVSSEIFNPATGLKIGEVSHASNETTESAIEAASKAFPAWQDTPPHKRARIMFNFKSLLEDNAESIARLITREHGKTIDDALGEVKRGIEVVEYACGAPELLKGEHAKNVGPSIDSWSEHQPMGVVAGVTPFNFPAMVPMWMFPMAIVCGNTFILKPSEKNPSPALKLAEFLTEAGLPHGVFNVVNGGREVVDTLLDDTRIEAISFVGSTPIAHKIYQRAAASGKRVQALGGAKNHAVIMPDADLENAAETLIGAAFGSCGQRCMAISVAVCVGDETADQLVKHLQQRTKKMKVGSGEQDGTDMGPLISADQLEKVKGYIVQGLIEGAKLVVDGRGLKVKGFENGYFVGPSVFDHVASNMTIYRDEIFGPVLCVMRVKTQDEAMALINQNSFANGTCIFTQDGGAARYFTDRIKVGMVGVNVPLPVPTAIHSFGGWRNSLFGDLCAYGPDSVRFYTHRKTVTQRWPNANTREVAQFSFPSGSGPEASGGK